MTLLEFFRTLYGTKADDDWLAITSIINNSADVRFFDTIDDAALEHVRARNKTKNVYFGVSLLDRPLGEGRRGTKRDITAIPGLWVDIDIEGPGHKKSRLFRNEDRAMEVVRKRIGLEPSLVIRTGGGVHAYFLFTELWRLRSEADQMKADRVSQGFQTALLREAKLADAVIDMTGDITRILRCPGTVNHKYDNQCYVIDPPGQMARYTPDQFFEFEHEAPIKIITGKTRRTPIKIVSSKQGGLTEQMLALAEADPHLARLLTRSSASEEDKKKWSDDSHSSYDLSITSQMANLGLDVDTVATALVVSRSLVDDKAARRPDYVARTISRAFNGVKTEDEKLSEVVATARQPHELTVSERNELLAELSVRFGVKILNIIEYTGTRHSYEMVTEHGKFELGTTEGISWQKVNAAMMQLEHRTIPTMKNDRWLGTVNLMLLAVEIKETGGSGDDEVWLRTYLMEYAHAGREYPHEGGMNYPSVHDDPSVWVKGNDRYIHAGSFKAWLKRENRDEKQDTSRFAARMVSLGCKPKRLGCRQNDRATSFDAWLVPKSIWDWGDESDEPRISGHGAGSDQAEGSMGPGEESRGEPQEEAVPEGESSGEESAAGERDEDPPF